MGVGSRMGLGERREIIKGEFNMNINSLFTFFLDFLFLFLEVFREE